MNGTAAVAMAIQPSLLDADLGLSLEAMHKRLHEMGVTVMFTDDTKAMSMSQHTLAHRVRMTATQSRLCQEERYLLLAYAAMQAVGRLEQALLNHMRICVSPRFAVGEPR